ncbi:MAG: YraN family protein [Saprospiraceae bacterium]|nr:YraN family protein [Saprospiraceae bacterium]
MDHIETGKTGEAIAARYLQEKGYRIVRQNFRSGKGEVDLIAWSPQGCLVFIEVKTRALDGFGGPEEAVDRKKQDLIARTAGAFMAQIGHEGELRFDIISVLLERGAAKSIRHAEDAFF